MILKEFWVLLISQDKFDNGDFENRGLRAYGHILKAPGSKLQLKDQKFEVVIWRFSRVKFKPNRLRRF